MTLRVQLVRAAPREPRAEGAVLLEVPRSAQAVMLDVHVTAGGFYVPTPSLPLELPVEGDSATIGFELVPMMLGRQIVEIEFFFAGSRVGYALVRTKVTRKRLVKKPCRMATMQDPAEGMTALESQGRAGAPTPAMSIERRLHVDWSEALETISYTVYSPIRNECRTYDHPCRGARTEIATYLRRLNSILTEVVSYGKPSEDRWDSTQLTMKGIGRQLFEAVVPAKLAQHMVAWQEGSTVIVSTNEEWIPWEIVHDGVDFWAGRFVLARDPRLGERPDVPEGDRVGAPSAWAVRRLLNVIGGGLDQAHIDRVQHLFSGLPAAVDVLIEKPISVVGERLADADALHMTCHGRMEPYLLQVAGTAEQTLNLLPETMNTLTLRPGGLVFVNACASSAPVLAFGRFTTFGWEFYRRGVEAFVGTLGPVPIDYAVDFAAEVYAELFKEGDARSIGEAVRAARRSAAAKHNLFWLLYCLYGRPDLRVALNPAS